MKTIKSYTDIAQSRKLAEILPLESADMGYPKDAFEYNYAKEPVCHYTGIGLAHPCWSLAALLGVLPEGIVENYYIPNLQKENGKYSIAFGSDELSCIADNPIDACYEMIIKLHKLKKL